MSFPDTNNNGQKMVEIALDSTEQPVSTELKPAVSCMAGNKKSAFESSSASKERTNDSEELELQLSEPEQDHPKPAKQASSQEKNKETKKKNSVASSKAGNSTKKKKDENEKPLKSTNIYIAVTNSDGDVDSTEAIKKKVETMGGTVKQKLTKSITHVVFKQGTKEIFEKATELKLKLVSPLWVHECDKQAKFVKEGDFKPEETFSKKGATKKTATSAAKRKRDESDDTDAEEQKKAEEPKAKKTKKKQEEDNENTKKQKNKPKSSSVQKDDEPKDDGKSNNKKEPETKKTKPKSKKAEDTKKDETIAKKSEKSDDGDVEMAENSKNIKSKEKDDSKTKPADKNKKPTSQDENKKDKKDKEDKKPLADVKKATSKNQDDSKISGTTEPTSDSNKKQQEKKEKAKEDEKANDGKKKATKNKISKSPNGKKIDEKKAKENEEQKKQEQQEKKTKKKSPKKPARMEVDSEEEEEESEEEEEILDEDGNIQSSWSDFKMVSNTNPHHAKYILESTNLEKEQISTIHDFIQQESEKQKKKKRNAIFLNLSDKKYDGQRFTHLIAGGPKRTLKTVFAIAFGARIVSYDWISKSVEEGKFVDDAQYEISTWTKPLATSREAIADQNKKSGDEEELASLKQLLLNEKKFSVVGDTNPSPSLLKSLIKECGGTIVSLRAADIIIAAKNAKRNQVFPRNNVKGRCIVVSEKWLIDAVGQYQLPEDYTPYEMKKEDFAVEDKLQPKPKKKLAVTADVKNGEDHQDDGGKTESKALNEEQNKKDERSDEKKAVVDVLVTEQKQDSPYNEDSEL